MGSGTSWGHSTFSDYGYHLYLLFPPLPGGYTHTTCCPVSVACQHCQALHILLPRTSDPSSAALSSQTPAAIPPPFPVGMFFQPQQHAPCRLMLRTWQ